MVVVISVCVRARARVCVCRWWFWYWCRGISRGVCECGCGATGVFAEEAPAAAAAVAAVESAWVCVVWFYSGSYICMCARVCVSLVVLVLVVSSCLGVNMFKLPLVLVAVW